MSIECKIREEAAPFEFEIASSALEKLLAKMLSVTGFVSASEEDRKHILASYKGKVFLIGYCNNVHAIMEVPVSGKVTGKSAAFNFDPTTLAGLIKKRGDIVLSYDKSDVNVSAVKGKYTAKLKTSKISVDQPAIVNRKFDAKSSGASVDAEVINHIFEGVRLTSLTDPYIEVVPNSFVQVKGKKLVVSSFCDWCVAKYERTLDAKHSDVRFAMPVKTYEVVNKFIIEEDESCSIYMEDRYFRVDGESFTLVLPPTQVTDEDFTRASAFLNHLAEPEVSFVADEQIYTVVDNIRAMANNEASGFSIDVSSKGAVRLQYKSDKGEVTDSFRVTDAVCKKKFHSQLDLTILNDLIKRLKGNKELPIQFHMKNGEAQCLTIPADVNGAKLNLSSYVPR